MYDEPKSEFLYHTSCDACGSSDGNAVYSNDTSYCFACSAYGKQEGTANNYKPTYKGTNVELIEIEYQALKKRSITEAICKQYRYGIGYDKNGEICQVASYFDKDKQLVGQKLRYPNKDFKFLGDSKASMMFGQQLFSNKGKKITICEGELDTLSVAQAFDGKYPVISLKNGASAAKKEIAANIEWLDGYEEIYLWFDNDEAGIKAVEDCIGIIPNEKLKIIRHPEYKDANELLVAKGKAGVVSAFYEAEKYTPDDIKTPSQMVDEVLQKNEMGFSYCYEGLTRRLYGRRYGEITTFGGGVSVGKTDFTMSMISHDIKEGRKVATFMLEQSCKETLQRVASKLDGQHYHIPDSDFKAQDLKDTIGRIEGLLYLFDNYGANSWEFIINKMKYLHHNHGVRIFYLDNLTQLNAASDDERRELDKMMAAFSGLCKELNVWLMVISHLNPTKNGNSHELGGRVEMQQLTGSRAIARWSNTILGIERNTLHEDENERNKGLIRILKDRFSGRATGHVVGFFYDDTTGLCHELEGLTELPKSQKAEEDFGPINSFGKGENNDF